MGRLIATLFLKDENRLHMYSGGARHGNLPLRLRKMLCIGQNQEYYFRTKAKNREIFVHIWKVVSDGKKTIHFYIHWWSSRNEPFKFYTMLGMKQESFIVQMEHTSAHLIHFLYYIHNAIKSTIHQIYLTAGSGI